MNMANIIRDQPMCSQEIITQYKSKVLLLVCVYLSKHVEKFNLLLTEI